MNIPTFVKKNKSLIVVLSAAILLSLAIIWQCFSVYGKVNETMELIKKADSEIQAINQKKNPNPVKGSTVIIEKNTLELRKQITALRRKIGNPYRSELLNFLANLESQAFLRSVAEKNPDSPKPAPVEEKVKTAAPAQTDAGETEKTEEAGEPEEVESKGMKVNPSDIITIHFTEDEFLTLFSDVYSLYYQNIKNRSESKDNDVIVTERNEIFDEFRTKVTTPPETMEFASDEDKALWSKGAVLSFDKAMSRFKENIQSKTIETITDVDAKHIFMHAMGLPRTMTSLECKYFVDDIQTKIEKKPSFIPGLDKYTGRAGDSGSLQMRIPEFLYNHNNSLPPPGNVIHILRHYRIIEDLYQRMRESKIQTLVSISSPLSSKPSGDPSGDLIRYMDPGREVGDAYRKFIYEITLNSSMDEIRSFINSLHQAFHENRVYEIQELKLFKSAQKDEVKDGNDKIIQLKTQGKENPANEDPSKLKSEASVLPDGKKKPLDENALNEIYSADDYGSVVIGARDLVTAVIRLNYIVYMGNILEKK